MRTTSRPFLLLLAIGCVAVAPISAQSADDPLHSSWEGCFPGLYSDVSTWIEEERAPAAAGECPCFTRDDLENLAARSLDLCVRGGFVDQVASWGGGRTAAGRKGFNVVVSRRCPRSPTSSCLYLHRHPGLDDMEQIYRRFENLTDDEAEACRRVLADWVDNRGGCKGTVLAESE